MVFPYRLCPHTTQLHRGVFIFLLETGERWGCLREAESTPLGCTKGLERSVQAGIASSVPGRPPGAADVPV